MIVQKLPLSFNINRLAQFSNIPLKAFTKGRFSNISDYFEELTRLHLYQLELQQNDAVTDEAESSCLRKYIARCLLRKLSREISKEHCKCPFRIYCDNLRPGNVLVDESSLAVTGVVGWGNFPRTKQINSDRSAWLLDATS